MNEFAEYFPLRCPLSSQPVYGCTEGALGPKKYVVDRIDMFHNTIQPHMKKVQGIDSGIIMMKINRKDD